MRMVHIGCDQPFDTVVTDPKTVIVSPNYPNAYGKNQHCEITIRYTEMVRVVFLEFLLVDCPNDYMEFFDGITSNSTRIGPQLCGNERPRPLYSSGKTMRILFHTDHDKEYDGFKILTESGNDMKRISIHFGAIIVLMKDNYLNQLMLSNFNSI